jgi:DNA-binding NarL/FixJ family response regulator
MLAADQHCRALVDANPAALLSAAEAFDRIDHRLFQARALEDAAVMLAQRADVVAARAAYTRARQIYTQLEAAWSIMRVDARLRPLGMRRGARGPRRRPDTGWGALTPTEVKIALHIAAGKSNPDIAAELYLSRNTVQTHVSHILSKLQCRSRIDVAIQAVNAMAKPERVEAPRV